jgi:hypothetical protein
VSSFRGEHYKGVAAVFFEGGGEPPIDLATSAQFIVGAGVNTAAVTVHIAVVQERWFIGAAVYAEGIALNQWDLLRRISFITRQFFCKIFSGHFANFFCV